MQRIQRTRRNHKGGDLWGDLSSGFSGMVDSVKSKIPGQSSTSSPSAPSSVDAGMYASQQQQEMFSGGRKYRRSKRSKKSRRSRVRKWR
jgi:hypothetical protein